VLNNLLKNSAFQVIFILHAVGIIGLQSQYQSLFISLTPFNLVISTYFLFSKHLDFSKTFWFFAILIFCAGYFVEVVGVHSQLIFGSYQYGNTLGPKFFGVPFLMGLNWVNLIYCVGIIFNRFSVPDYLKSFFGAGILVLLDLFLEPVAMKYDFWSWKNNIIPIQNYIAWFICSYIFLNLFYVFSFKKENRIAFKFMMIQFLFFIILCYLYVLFIYHN